MILSADFLTPQHLVCLKNQAVEIISLDFLPEITTVTVASEPVGSVLGHTLFARGSRHVNRLQYVFPDKSTSLRGAVFSQPAMVHTSDSTTIGISLLAFDVLRGLFHYNIEARFIHNSDSSSPMSAQDGSVLRPLDMNVSLLAAHLMAQLVSPASDAFRGPTAPALPRSGFTPGSRGFISACALGDQGKRGVWVERHRVSMGRSVFGFSTSDYCARDGTGMEAHGESQAIQGRCMHEMNSYDLRGMYF